MQISGERVFRGIAGLSFASLPSHLYAHMPRGVLRSREVRLPFPGINSFSYNNSRKIYCLCNSNKAAFLSLLLVAAKRNQRNVKKRGGEFAERKKTLLLNISDDKLKSLKLLGDNWLIKALKR